ncbi:unnamed protein product [Cylicocyclus nassatus]|uniref:Protein kinase domain-containing protein n=1 Tax=Cylicocyclus nassatus TaxID=53992 RepID=A0AA36GHT1_CYLNA|nr:unnamed protein product [Cylicocyclus nassatus]
MEDEVARRAAEQQLADTIAPTSTQLVQLVNNVIRFMNVGGLPTYRSFAKRLDDECEKAAALLQDAPKSHPSVQALEAALSLAHNIVPVLKERANHWEEFMKIKMETQLELNNFLKPLKEVLSKPRRSINDVKKDFDVISGERTKTSTIYDKVRKLQQLFNFLGPPTVYEDVQFIDVVQQMEKEYDEALNEMSAEIEDENLLCKAVAHFSIQINSIFDQLYKERSQENIKNIEQFQLPALRAELAMSKGKYEEANHARKHVDPDSSRITLLEDRLKTLDSMLDHAKDVEDASAAFSTTAQQLTQENFSRVKVCSFAFKSLDDDPPQNSCNEPPTRMNDRAPISTRKRRPVNRVTKANQDQGLCNTNTIPEIPLSQIDGNLDGTLLGEGTFGRVVKCRYFDNCDLQWKEVAIKYANPAYRNVLVREAKIFYTYLNHKNCIKFFGLYNCPLNGTGIVMELMDCSLAWLVSNHSIKYEIDHAISWLYQLSDAMSFFHSKEQVHRDLKLQNLLLCNGYHILKVCDFGTYTTLHESMTMEKGTLITMAPEVIRASKYYDEKCDIYSFGIIMWQIIARRLSPYQQERYYVILNVAENILRPPELSCDPLLSRFYKACWDGDPDVRPNSEQVKQYFAILKKAFPNDNRDLIGTNANGHAVISQLKLATPFTPQHRRARSDPFISYNRRSSLLCADLASAGSMEDVCPNPENTGVGDIEQAQNENVEHDLPPGFMRPYLRSLGRRRNPWNPQDPFLPNPLLFVQRLFPNLEGAITRYTIAMHISSVPHNPHKVHSSRFAA